MGNKVRSARGEMVDFDLIKIKEAMQAGVPNQDVRAREDFIEKKLHRRIKKGLYKKAEPVQVAAVDVEPKMPGAVTEAEAVTIAETPVVKAPADKIKQKAR